MQHPLQQELETTWKNLEEVFSSFPANKINTVPFEGSWTPAQVADHILKSAQLAGVINGTTAPTERDPGEKIEGIKKIFLDFDLKMTSPREIEPTREPLEKDNLLNDMDAAARALYDAAQNLDLSLTCTDLELPKTGFLTRLEWLHFSMYHTLRHTHQLQKIRTAMMKNV